MIVSGLTANAESLELTVFVSNLLARLCGFIRI